VTPPETSSFRVPADHPSLPGHFPGQPVVPGVLILDEVAARACEALGGGLRPARLPQVKFVAPLLPDQDARIELDLDRAQHRVRFRVARDGQLLAAGELVFVPA
jgi:3-hydroxyacyl-[acyl-carrier-protein] dehydratase